MSAAISQSGLWLDLADKVIKLVAVALGGVWTYWNYRKSRTYAQKMELQLTTSLFQGAGVFYEVTARLKNIGASRHVVDQDGSFIEVKAIFDDLSELNVDFVPVFSDSRSIEPGETISEIIPMRLDTDTEGLVWLHFTLRVVSHGLEWRQYGLMRYVDGASVNQLSLEGDHGNLHDQGTTGR